MVSDFEEWEAGPCEIIDLKRGYLWCRTRGLPVGLCRLEAAGPFRGLW